MKMTPAVVNLPEQCQGGGPRQVAKVVRLRWGEGKVHVQAANVAKSWGCGELGKGGVWRWRWKGSSRRCCLRRSHSSRRNGLAVSDHCSSESGVPALVAPVPKIVVSAEAVEYQAATPGGSKKV